MWPYANAVPNGRAGGPRRFGFGAAWGGRLIGCQLSKKAARVYRNDAPSAGTDGEGLRLAIPGVEDNGVQYGKRRAWAPARRALNTQRPRWADQPQRAAAIAPKLSRSHNGGHRPSQARRRHKGPRPAWPTAFAKPVSESPTSRTQSIEKLLGRRLGSSLVKHAQPAVPRVRGIALALWQPSVPCNYVPGAPERMAALPVPASWISPSDGAAGRGDPGPWMRHRQPGKPPRQRQNTSGSAPRRPRPSVRSGERPYYSGRAVA